MSTSPTTKLVLDWGQGFEKRDTDHLAKYLHKDFRHITYPRSLKRPELNKDEWIAQMSEIFPLWAETEHTKNSLIEAPGKVIYHFNQLTKTKVGIDMAYEAINIVDIVTDDDGSLKIKKVEEFVDSKALVDFMQALEAAKPK